MARDAEARVRALDRRLDRFVAVGHRARRAEAHVDVVVQRLRDRRVARVDQRQQSRR